MSSKLDKIFESLCYWDKRNPYFNIKEEYGYDKEEVDACGYHAKKDCYCDNCFKGKTPLAEAYLKLLDTLNSDALLLTFCDKLRELDIITEEQIVKIKEFLDEANNN